MTSYPSKTIIKASFEAAPKDQGSAAYVMCGAAQVLKRIIKARLAELPGDSGFSSVLLLHKARLPRRPGVPSGPRTRRLGAVDGATFTLTLLRFLPFSSPGACFSPFFLFFRFLSLCLSWSLLSSKRLESCPELPVESSVTSLPPTLRTSFRGFSTYSETTAGRGLTRGRPRAGAPPPSAPRTPAGAGRPGSNAAPPGHLCGPGPCGPGRRGSAGRPAAPHPRRSGGPTCASCASCPFPTGPQSPPPAPGPGRAAPLPVRARRAEGGSGARESPRREAGGRHAPSGATPLPRRPRASRGRSARAVAGGREGGRPAHRRERGAAERAGCRLPRCGGSWRPEAALQPAVEGGASSGGGLGGGAWVSDFFFPHPCFLSFLPHIPDSFSLSFAFVSSL